MLTKLRNRELRRRVFEASLEPGVGGGARQPPDRRADRPAAGRAGPAARLRHARRRRAGRLDRPHHGGGRRDARVDGAGVRGQRRGRGGRAGRDAAARDGVELAAWDWAFYSEQVRAERYAVDTTALRPYFELDRVLVDGVFYAAELLYGYRFAPRPDLAGYHPDVRVWEVTDADGDPVGLYLGDFFAREGKRGGAWMSSFVRQSRLLGTRPVVVNNLNVSRAAGRAADAADPRRGQHALPRVRPRAARAELGGHLPAVLRHRRAARLRRVPEPGQRDVGALAARCSRNYARHVETGEPLPGRSSRRSTPPGCGARASGRSSTWPRPCSTRPGTGSRPDTEVGDPIAFEQRALEAAGVASALVPPRYRTTYFQHIFAGGYAAGYYSYIWSEVLDADTVEWFKENGGLRRENGDAFRDQLLAVGGSIDPLAAFRAVRGRDADPAPLLRRRGLVTRPEPGRRVGSLATVLSCSLGSLQDRSGSSTPGAVQLALTTRGAEAPGRGRRGRRPRAPGGWAAGGRTPCSGAPPASPCPTSPPARSAPWAPGSRWPGRRAGRRRAATTGRRAVVAVVPVGVGRHGRRAVRADEAGVLRPPGAAPTRRGQGTNGSMPTTSTVMSRPLGAW